MLLKEYTVQGEKYRFQLFDKINTSEQAYLIGYLLGDGGYGEKTHKRLARMFVTSTEEYIINYFQNNFCPDTTISSRIPVNKTRNIKSNKLSYKIQFSSKFYETFNKFGLLSVKTGRTFHNIPKDEMKSLLLGLFDADGCISWGKRKDRNRIWANFLITHPNIKMLEKIQRFLTDELGVNTGITLKGEEKCYILRTSDRFQVVKILDYLYESNSEIYNITKNENYKAYKKALLH